MALNRNRVRRQMPRIYGNLQKTHRDWRPFWRGLVRIFWGMAAVALLYVLFFGPAFRVRTVEVQGVTLSNQEFITKTVPLGGSIWRLPQAQITAAIINNQPVDSVDISRGLPSTVEVVVHEREPIVAWVSAGTTTLLDASGIAFLQYPNAQLPDSSTKLGAKIAILPHVVDTQNLPVKVNTQVAGASFVLFTKDTLANFHTYLSSYVWDHAEVGATLYDITFVSKTGLHVEMNTLADSGIQSRNLARLLEENKAQPNATIDLRIDRWAYVH